MMVVAGNDLITNESMNARNMQSKKSNPSFLKQIVAGKV